MKSSKRLVFQLISIHIILAFVLQGCATPSAPTESQSALVPGTASPTPLPTATTSPTATPSPAPVATPSPAYTSTSKYIINDYSASDGKNVYYFSDSGINCMDMDGGNDRDIGIVDCYEFIAVNEEGLYCLTYDRAYVSTEVEDTWQFCNSFNLMFYDANTREIKMIYSRLLDAYLYGNGIYIVDHTRHSRIIRYDLSEKVLSDVNGFPSGGNASDYVDIYDYNGTLYLCCDVGENNMEYPVSGNTIGAKGAAWYYRSDETDNSYTVDYQNDTVSIWAGSDYKQFNIKDVYDVMQYDSKFYILTYDDSSDNSAATLFEVTTDGTVKKISGPYAMAGGEIITDEIAAGWFFSFLIEIDGGTAYGLVFKQKIG